MMDAKNVLASRGRFGCVYQCDCGTVHLAVGPVDLKFNAESLVETYEMLGEAVQELKRRSAGDLGSRQSAIGGPQQHSN